MDTVSNIITTIYSNVCFSVHKIFRCSHLISHYFSKTTVEKKQIVDIYLLKIFLVNIDTGIYYESSCTQLDPQIRKSGTGEVSL